MQRRRWLQSLEERKKEQEGGAMLLLWWWCGGGPPPPPLLLLSSSCCWPAGRLAVVLLVVAGLLLLLPPGRRGCWWVVVLVGQKSVRTHARTHARSGQITTSRRRLPISQKQKPSWEKRGSSTALPPSPPRGTVGWVVFVPGREKLRIAGAQRKPKNGQDEGGGRWSLLQTMPYFCRKCPAASQIFPPRN